VFALGATAQKAMLVIHGGAGTITRASMTGDTEKQYREALEQSLRIGHAVLVKGGSSMDAVEASIRFMEDSPLFNAGKGAVFTHDGRNELDAAVMDGKTKKAGSVAGVTIIRNPITAARAVMEKSPHVMMTGEGAEAFAKEAGGIEFVPESYFRTDLRWQQLQQALEREKRVGARPRRAPTVNTDDPQGAYFGTVGAVALDQAGNLAAATSTGGLTNKRWGRVGDSPIIGAGTYASNSSCAISATGTGEYFIRYTVAKDICARVEYRGVAAQTAADEVVNGVLKAAGGAGGVVGLDRRGAVVMSFNTTGMGRGYVGDDGQPSIMFTADR
jgi:beta-aspartyl-peptidase (threonine type)